MNGEWVKSQLLLDAFPCVRLGAGEFVNKPYVLEKFGWAVRRELDRET